MTDEEYSKILRKKMKFMGWRTIIVFLGFFPAMGLFVFLLGLIGIKNVNFAIVPGIGYMIFMVYCGLDYQYMKCPKCNRTYFWHFVINPSFQKSSFKLFFGRKCAHCGLELK